MVFAESLLVSTVEG